MGRNALWRKHERGRIMKGEGERDGEGVETRGERWVKRREGRNMRKR